MEADEYTLALIEQFGVKALRGQLGENREAYRKETKRWQEQHARRTMADALALAAKHPPPPSCRIVLYGSDPRTLAELAKLGIRYEAGDG